MILNEKGRESETVTKPWGASLEFAGKRGPWASSSGVLGSDSGEGAGREGEVVNYTSIPGDAPEPQRYLFCHGDGAGVGRKAPGESRPVRGERHSRGWQDADAPSIERLRTRR